MLANKADPFWNTVGCAAAAEAKKRGIDYKSYDSKSNDAAVLNTNFNAALLDQPQGVIINAPSIAQFAGQIHAQEAKGVAFTQPVGLNPPTYDTIVGNQDAPPELISMAQQVVKGGGSVMTLGGSAAVPILKDRYRLLNQKLGEVPGVTVLPVQYDNFDASKAQVDVNSAILAHPDLKLIISSNGGDTPGVLAALKQAKRPDIKFIAVDAIPLAVDALKAGQIMAIESTPAGEIGQLEVDVLVDYAAKHPGSHTPITDHIKTTVKVGVLTQSNLNDPAVQGLIYKTTCG